MGLPVLSLEGKVAIVTGSRRGMGKAIALRFAEAGADVAVCDLVAGSELDAVAKHISQLGRRSLAMQVDIRERASVTNFVQKVEDTFGGIDILANVAGVATLMHLIDLPEEDWDTVLDTNLKGYYICCQVVGKRMAKRNKGSIISIGSIDGWNPAPGQVVYNCSKAGVHMLTRVLAFELAQYNIRVNAIAPGWIKTGMTEFLNSSPSDKATVLADIGLRRLGEPYEIANAALFLVSDLASYISGAILRVDGVVNPFSLPASAWEMSKGHD